MKYTSFYAAALSVVFILLAGCKEQNNKEVKKEPKLKEEAVAYTVDSLSMKSFIYYDENAKGKLPAVLVVHEWWGLNEYAKRRARMLAELGYIAMAVDMYGNGRMGNDPDAAGKLAMPYYLHPDMAKKIFEAALTEFKKNQQVDETRMAGIGYCFGGGVLLNLARMGVPLKAVVSFHGSLVGTPADKELTRAEILVCHGDADPLVPKEEVENFKKQMDSIGKSYTFKTYPGALHAFTNPDATEAGKKFNLPVAYDAAADSASWNDMKEFFTRIFR